MTLKFKDSSLLLTLRLSLMLGAIFWVIVYKLSEAGLKVPDFVYVNF